METLWIIVFHDAEANNGFALVEEWGETRR